MGAPPPPPPPVLVDDMIWEILIRLPPSNPACLLRASLVCKPWRRLVSDPAFLSRYREFHGAPPVIGLVFNEFSSETARFVPTTRFRPRDLDRLGSYALDARHGRVLFRARLADFEVWDPVTDEQRGMPMPLDFWSNGAVVCAAVGCDDHLDCHGGPFLVACVSTNNSGLTSACVYSSAAGEWSKPTSVEQLDLYGDRVDIRPSLLVGNALYFICKLRPRVLEYDLGRRVLAVIDLPAVHNVKRIVLMTAEDGGLGFADVQESRLHLWSRVAGHDGAVAWSQCRVIELETLPPIRGFSTSPAVIGFAAEGVSTIFIRTNAGIFKIELASDRVSDISSMASIDLVIPYMSFYTPDRARGIMPPP